MMINVVVGVVVGFIMLSTGTALRAQPVQIIQDTLRIDSPQQLSEKTRVDGIERAERLMHLGEYERAADLLEVLYGQYPDHPGIKSMLAACYEQSKNYDMLLSFLRRRMSVERGGFQLYRNMGRAYILSGHPDSAETFFYQAVRQVADNERAYASVASVYHKFGHYRRESDFIDSSRVLTGNPRLLADRMGDALAAQRQYAAATLEYLAYMEQDTLTARVATERLEAMLRFPESTDTVMAILSERIKTQPNNRRLLGTYGRILMDQDQYDDAFVFFRGLDSLSGGQGGEIVYFIRECNIRGQSGKAIEAGQYLLDHKPQSTLINAVRFEMAEAYIATGRYQEALTSYQTVSEDLIRPAHQAEARVKIGYLYKDHLGDLEKAGMFLKGVTSLVPGGRYDLEARFGLADIAVRENNLDSAINLYLFLQEQNLQEEFVEQIEFALAEIYLFRGDYKEAADRFRRIISRYPRGFYVNDAIQYSLIISETLEAAPKQIDLFSSAEYYRYIDRSDSLEYYLTKICRVGIPSLAPVSYLRLAQMYFDQSRFDEATESIDSLELRHPESYFLPYGLKLKADIYLLSPQSREEAMALYRQLLEEYATYPFAAEIRDIIRRETPSDRI
jgi:tetratricopeptide (TPR) repeat protein